MMTSLLTTKLYMPPSRPTVVQRPHLIERLNRGLHGKLTLISAPAGFGKTTLVSQWVTGYEQPVAWLSLDEGDNDPARFMLYLVAALQTVHDTLGNSILSLLQSPQPPPIDTLLTTLLNDLATITEPMMLVLDDYHVIDTPSIDEALAFLISHLPPQIHLVIASREDPQLPLSRLRARGQLTELRVADLRFTLSEATGFLNQVMNLDLSESDVAMLETRTEGWIAGLQLAAISMQGQNDTSGFIQSFTGSHHFVLDYLLEEVLQRQTPAVQTFLLQTSILERFCDSLCDAVLDDNSISGLDTLAQIEQSNLFVIPLDNQRRWYRYHHLFADLLRQRLNQQHTDESIKTLHIRASQWFEDHDLEIEAFQYAARGDDIDRAERLIDGNGMPLYYRGVISPLNNWMESLPNAILESRPALMVTYAAVMSFSGKMIDDVEPKLQIVQSILENQPDTDSNRNLLGHIAAIRSRMAAGQYNVDLMLKEGERALGLLSPDNLPVRASTAWALGMAYQFKGDHHDARRAYTEAITMAEATGNTFINVVASTGLGIIQEAENQLHQSAETFHRLIDLVGEPKQPATCEAFLGLARITYEWNDLEQAKDYAHTGWQLAKPLESADTVVGTQTFLAYIKFIEGDLDSAIDDLATCKQLAIRRNFVEQIPLIVHYQVLIQIAQNNLKAAEKLATSSDVPLSLARVYLAQGKHPEALELVASFRQQVEEQNWKDQQLRAMILQTLIYEANGHHDQALATLEDALELAESGGFIRRFVDEGQVMGQLIAEIAQQGILPAYTRTLLDAFGDASSDMPSFIHPSDQPLIEPLSERELEVLQLISEGLSNQQISDRLYLALSTVKGHNRNIFDKLGVKRRTEAVARATELGLL